MSVDGFSLAELQAKAERFQFPADFEDRIREAASVGTGFGMQLPIPVTVAVLNKILIEGGYFEDLSPAYQGRFNAGLRDFFDAFIQDCMTAGCGNYMEVRKMSAVDFARRLKASMMNRLALTLLLKEVMSEQVRLRDTEKFKKILALYEEERQTLENERDGVRQRLEQALAERDAHAEKASLDPLLGMKNRGALKEACDRIRKEDPEGDYIVIFIDIDHFKKVNDTYGHSAGDAVLEQFAQILFKLVRHGAVFRGGGEEFILMLKKTPDATRLDTLSESIRAVTEAYPFVLPDGTVIYKTVSIGETVEKGATLYGDNVIPSGERSAIAVADQLMYKAKQGGRNRVCRS